MNFVKNLVIYTLFAGGGSIGISYYFISDAFLTYAILGLIIFSLLTTVYELITDGRKFSLNFQTHGHNDPEGQYAADGDQMSVVYYTVGVIIFGMAVII